MSEGTERRVTTQEELLSGTLAAALDAVIVIDAEDRVLEFNPAASEIFGFAREEALGRDLAELIVPPALRERHREALQRHVATGEKSILDRRIELTALRRDAVEIPVELTVTRMPGSEPPLFVAFIRDLTARRAMESALAESERRFEDLVAQIRDYAIFMMDLERRPTSWNEGVERVLGFTQQEFIGIDVVSRIFTPEDIEAGVPDQEFGAAAQTGAAGDDRWMRRKDGSRFFALGVTLGRRDADGRLIGYAKVMRDRTDQKRLELDLRRTAEELARANSRQKDFLALLSHELRNPLAPIRSGVEVLRLTQPADERSARVLDMLERQISHLVRLVDDLLDLSRVSTGKITLRKERIDLVPALQQAAEIAASQCAANGQKLDLRLPEEPLYMEADRTRIVQMVSNLLHNGCKFTPRNGRIVLTLRRHESMAVIEVADTGVGLLPHQLARIFEMFEQVEKPMGAQAGLGIGLALTRSLVEMHGGTVEVQSAGAGMGSTFTIRLPAPPEL